MVGSSILKRIGGVLTAPLWEEPAETAEERRRRLAVTLPVVAIAGAVLGYLAAHRWGEPTTTLVAGGAISACLFSYLAAQLDAFVRRLLRARSGSRRAALLHHLRDLATGGALGYAAAVIVDTPAAGSAAAGALLMLLFGHTAGRLYCGTGGRALDPVLGAPTAAVPPDPVLADTLASRGFHDAALAEYGRLCAAAPHDPEPYLAAARMLRDRAHRPEQALAWFERARAEARLCAGEDVVVTREIIEIREKRLADAAGAARELAGLAARHAGTPVGDWALRDLEELRGRVLRGQGPAPRRPTGRRAPDPGAASTARSSAARRGPHPPRPYRPDGTRSTAP
jgi:hypothetical protein